MSWRTASYFSSRPTAATNPSSFLTAIPKSPAPIGEHQCSQTHEQAGAQAQTTGEFPHKIAHFFDSKPLRRAARPPEAPSVARFPHFVSPAPAAEHTYLDAFNGKI